MNPWALLAGFILVALLLAATALSLHRLNRSFGEAAGALGRLAQQRDDALAAVSEALAALHRQHEQQTLALRAHFSLLARPHLECALDRSGGGLSVVFRNTGAAALARGSVVAIAAYRAADLAPEAFLDAYGRRSAVQAAPGGAPAAADGAFAVGYARPLPLLLPGGALRWPLDPPGDPFQVSLLVQAAGSAGEALAAHYCGSLGAQDRTDMASSGFEPGGPWRAFAAGRRFYVVPEAAYQLHPHGDAVTVTRIGPHGEEPADLDPHAWLPEGALGERMAAGLGAALPAALLKREHHADALPDDWTPPPQAPPPDYAAR